MTMPAEMFIRYVDLFKSFGDKQVLSGVNLTIERGQTVVVLGGSGSGKSVLLRHTIGPVSYTHLTLPTILLV